MSIEVEAPEPVAAVLEDADHAPGTNGVIVPDVAKAKKSPKASAPKDKPLGSDPPRSMLVPIEQIAFDSHETQSRVSIDPNTVEEYTEVYRDKPTTMPPIALFVEDGAKGKSARYFIGDGWQRALAAREAGLKSIKADVHTGTVRDAILWSVGSNSRHGRPRTSADRKKAIETLLHDSEWSKKSDRWIADVCDVSPAYVGRIRNRDNDGIDVTPRQTKDGRTITAGGRGRPKKNPDVPPGATVISDEIVNPPPPEMDDDVPPWDQEAEDAAQKEGGDLSDKEVMEAREFAIYEKLLAEVKIREQLQDKPLILKRLDAEILFWLRVQKARDAFRAAIQPHLKQVVKDLGGKPILYSYQTRRFLRFRHPSQWSICADCHGEGMADGPGGRKHECTKCYGVGIVD
jgi:hypothetical protein